MAIIYLPEVTTRPRPALTLAKNWRFSRYVFANFSGRAARQGPAMQPEIEITPAMADAGVREWVKGRDWLESEEDVVARIFRAMWRVSRTSDPA